MKYILSIDQSTQGTKILLIDENGDIANKVFKAHNQIINTQGYVSHDMLEIYNNIISGVRELMVISSINELDISAISLTNQRETTVAFDNEGNPLALAIVWQCNRSVGIVNRLTEDDKKYVYNATGLNASPYFPASKMTWLIENELNITNTIHLSTVDSYLIYKLTNGKVFATDYSNASRTQLFNIKTLSWDEKLCKMFNVDIKYLPMVLNSNDSFGETTFEGLFKNPIPIRASLGDSHAALFAQNCLECGKIKATYGTGSSIMLNTGNKIIKSNYGLSTSIGYSIDNNVVYVLEGNINYSGAIISWLKDDVELISSTEEIEDLINIANKEDNTIIVPAFTGLGAPYWNTNAKAMIMNITRITKKAEIVKSAIQSIALQINDVILCMKQDYPSDILEIKTDGGPTKNKYLMQFQADISKCDILCSDVNELSGLGSAYMAGITIGLYDYNIFKSNKYNLYKSLNDYKTKIDDWHKALEIIK